MSDLISYATQLLEREKFNLPPVDRWNPEYTGEIDIVIKRDGIWFHDGEPIKRADLVRLFSSILRKEADDYFLVTPVEKQRIDVEDVPFLAVQFEHRQEGAAQVLSFTTNLGECVEAGKENPITYRPIPGATDLAPYIHIRNGLEARILTSIFYDLMDLVVERNVDGVGEVGLFSGGEFFKLSDANEILEK